jgi:ABC-2 type transport system ATP-binding protein
MTILSVSNLSKKIKNKSIIENINFVVNRSEILGLLGPNGANSRTNKAFRR